MVIEIKRFKTDDGREGSCAPIGNGLIKLLYDDGNMAIVTDPDFRQEENLEAGRNSRLPAQEPSWPLVLANDIPALIEKLSHGTGAPRYAVLMFIPRDSTDQEFS